MDTRGCMLGQKFRRCGYTLCFHPWALRSSRVLYYIPLEYIIKIWLCLYIRYYFVSVTVRWSTTQNVLSMKQRCIGVLACGRSRRIYYDAAQGQMALLYFELVVCTERIYNNLLQITRQITRLLLTLKPVSLSRINFGVSVSTPHPAHRAAFTRNSIRNTAWNRGKSFILFPQINWGLFKNYAWKIIEYSWIGKFFEKN